MMSAVGTFMKRYGSGVITAAAAGFTAAASTFDPVPVVAVTTALVAVAMATLGGIVIGRMHAHHELIIHLGRQPVSMHVDLADDGSAVAFVQRVDGDLTTVQVPPDVLDDPHAVVAYVLDAIDA